VAKPDHHFFKKIIELAGMPATAIAYVMAPTTFIDCCAATYGAYWALSLALSCFTPFIVNGLGFSQQDAGWISVLPWVLGASIVPMTGFQSQLLLGRGTSTRLARGVLGAAPLVAYGLTLCCCQSWMEQLVALLMLGSGAIYVVCLAMIGEFTPASQRGAFHLRGDLRPGGHCRAICHQELHRPHGDAPS
jgi:hypothetical protein